MKITVDLPEEDLREICKLTGIRKKGPAIRKLLADSMQLQSRAETARKFLTGAWCAEAPGFEQARQNDRQKASTLAEVWRD